MAFKAVEPSTVHHLEGVILEICCLGESDAHATSSSSLNASVLNLLANVLQPFGISSLCMFFEWNFCNREEDNCAIETDGIRGLQWPCSAANRNEIGNTLVLSWGDDKHYLVQKILEI
jgi:hypothetical protein